MRVQIQNLKDLQIFASVMAQNLKPGNIILLTGELGAGKTTLVKSIGKALKVKEHITSPSFTLIQKYQGKYPILHLDLYRLHSEKEMLNLDLQNFLDKPDSLVFIEWGNKLNSLTPAHSLILDFSIIDDKKRTIELADPSKNFISLFKQLEHKYHD